MRLRSGLVQRVAVATITFPLQAVAAKPPAAKAATAWWRHLILVAILLLLLAVAAFALRLSWRARRGGGGLGPAATVHH
jgi:hypothetical protein